MILDANKEYASLSGIKVRLFLRESNRADSLILGAYTDGVGNWYPAKWDQYGACKSASGYVQSLDSLTLNLTIEAWAAIYVNGTLLSMGKTVFSEAAARNSKSLDGWRLLTVLNWKVTKPIV